MTGQDKPDRIGAFSNCRRPSLCPVRSTFSPHTRRTPARPSVRSLRPATYLTYLTYGYHGACQACLIWRGERGKNKKIPGSILIRFLAKPSFSRTNRRTGLLSSFPIFHYSEAGMGMDVLSRRFYVCVCVCDGRSFPPEVISAGPSGLSVLSRRIEGKQRGGRGRGESCFSLFFSLFSSRFPSAPLL